jgi:hypothetical protein
MEMVKAGLGIDEAEETLEDLFCSEAVAELYQAMGLLPEDVPSNNYVPADFA